MHAQETKVIRHQSIQGALAIYGSRHTQVFNIQPKSQGLHQNFFGFLPKAMPLPPSGPSKQHNSIQLQNSRGKQP
ncbi:hypothetical protein HKD37_16G046134 [Glycine soja]